MLPCGDFIAKEWDFFATEYVQFWPHLLQAVVRLDQFGHFGVTQPTKHWTGRTLFLRDQLGTIHDELIGCHSDAALQRLPIVTPVQAALV